MSTSTHNLPKRVVHELKDELADFLDGPNRNQYISDADSICNVYTRKGLHYIDGVVEQTLDVASISVEPEFRGNGLGSSVINMMHRNNPFGITFVESLLNDSLYTHLKKCGWKDVAESNPPCLYLETQHERTLRPLR